MKSCSPSALSLHSTIGEFPQWARPVKSKKKDPLETGNTLGNKTTAVHQFNSIQFNSRWYDTTVAGYCHNHRDSQHPAPSTQHPAQPQLQPIMRSTSILRSIMNNNKTSYYEPHTYRMSPALLRARQPYFVKNMIGLAILMAVPVGIYAYTYNFLNQDDFDDIPIPPLDDETIKKLQKEYEEEKKSII